jgi:hypothetical protein
MKSHNKPKKWQQLIVLAGFYAVLALIITLSILYYFNNFYLTANINTSKALSSFDKVSVQSKSETLVVTTIPRSAINISFSHDNKYCMYLDKGILYIQTVGSNKIIQKITESSQITKALLLTDRNIVIYFTIDKKSKSNLEIAKIKTYNIDKNERTVQQSFSISKGSIIKDIEYSSLTNLILVNTEKRNIRSISNKVYYINIMNRVRSLATQNNVYNMVLLNKSLSLYYQNGKGVLYCNSKRINNFDKQKVNLIGRDTNDNIYIQSVLKRDTVYVLNNDKIAKTLKLQDSNYIKILCNRSDIYVVYKGYVVNLTTDINRKINYNSNLDFVDIVGDRIYLKDKNNTLKSNIISN